MAFLAPSSSTVRAFYAAALKAGGQGHGAPALRNAETGCYNAAVLDLDGNSVEVMCRNDAQGQGTGSVAGSSRALSCVGGKVEDLGSCKSSCGNGGIVQSVVKSSARSMLSSSSTIKPTLETAPAAASRSQEPQIQTTTTIATITAPSGSTTNMVIGTVLGAAAGAAVAYAMCKSEEDSERAEIKFNRTVQTRRSREAQRGNDICTIEPISRVAPTASDAMLSLGGPSSQPLKTVKASQMQTYRSPTYDSVVASTAPAQQMIEYTPAPLALSQNSLGIFNKSMTGSSNAMSWSQARYVDRTGSNAGKEEQITSTHQSAATPSLITSPIPDHASDVRSASKSSHISQSSKSKYSMVKSPQSQQSLPSSKPKSNVTKAASKSRQRSNAPDNASNKSTTTHEQDSKKTSTTNKYDKGNSSTLKSARGRASSKASHYETDHDEINTITPSDSISCVKESDKSAKSNASNVSKRSKSTKAAAAAATRNEKVSDAGSVSTVRPAKRDSTVSLPVRSAGQKTSESGRGGKRSVASFA